MHMKIHMTAIGLVQCWKLQLLCWTAVRLGIKKHFLHAKSCKLVLREIC